MIEGHDDLCPELTLASESRREAVPWTTWRLLLSRCLGRLYRDCSFNVNSSICSVILVTFSTPCMPPKVDAESASIQQLSRGSQVRIDQNVCVSSGVALSEFVDRTKCLLITIVFGLPFVCILAYEWGLLIDSWGIAISVT